MRVEKEYDRYVSGFLMKGVLKTWMKILQLAIMPNRPQTASFIRFRRTLDMDVPQADVTFPAMVASLVTVSGVRGCGFPVATIGRPTVATTSPSHGFCQQRRAVSRRLIGGRGPVPLKLD